jgi:hypothetical protein
MLEAESGLSDFPEQRLREHRYGQNRKLAHRLIDVA